MSVKFWLASGFLVFALFFFWLKMTKEINRGILINESILHLSPRNVSLDSVILEKPNLSNVVRTRKSYIPPESTVRITPKDPTKQLKDVVNIDYDVYGWTFRPGLSVCILPAAIGIDAKFAFANRWGLASGFDYRLDYPNKGITPSVKITYRVDNDTLHIQNTEVFGGVMALPKTTGMIGVRINL